MADFWHHWRRGNRRRSGMANEFRPTVEALEERLMLSWSAAPPTSIRLPSSFTSLTLDGQGDAAGTGTIATTEVDFYKFTASVSGSYRITTTTPSGNLNTVLGVFNGRGRRIAFNNDISRTNTDSDLTVTLLAGQRYYFGITNLRNTPAGSYNWYVNGPATGPVTDDDYEPNDSKAEVDAADVEDTDGTDPNLGELDSVKTITGLKMLTGDDDWFKLSMTGEGGFSDYVSITFNSAEGDLDLYLYDSDGTSQLGSSEGVSDVEQISFFGLDTGTYYVKVVGFGGAVSSNYTLTIDPIGANAPLPEGNFEITLSLSGFTSSQRAIFQQAADRWEQIITGELPDETYNGKPVDDILIEGSAGPIDFQGGILGQAAPDAFRSSCSDTPFLPYHGFMEFDSADLGVLERDGELFSVILHEMAHVLGFGTIWEDLNLLVGAGTSSSNPRFTGAQAKLAYKEMFGLTGTPDVPVEDGGGPGTADSHWRESVFDNELMTGFLNSGTANPLSRVTVASMADLGYTVNLDAADGYTPPSNISSNQSMPSGSGGNGMSSKLVASGGSNWRDLIFALTDDRKGKRNPWSADAYFAALGAS